MVPLHPYRTKSQDYSIEEECPPSKIGPFPYCYRTSLSKVFLGLIGKICAKVVKILKMAVVFYRLG